MNAFEVFMGTIAVGGLFLIGYDVYLVKKGLPTISHETKRMGQHAPILAWAFGVVAGGLAAHFWWAA